MKLNFFNFEKRGTQYFLTNDLGLYTYLSDADFQHLVNEDFESLDALTLTDLKNKYFIYDTEPDVFIEKMVEPYRNSKQYSLQGTSLHIFVMTNACNMNCVYCQAQDTDQKQKGKMSIETAEKAVDIALQTPVRRMTFEFQGGEPLTNFGVIKHIIQYSSARCNDKEIDYSVVTNTMLLTDEMLRFFQEHDVSISTSLDGNPAVHNQNRRTIAGEDTHGIVVKNITRIRQTGISIGAIQTTTKASLDYPKKIVQEYVKDGLTSVFIRPLTPLGYANEHWDEIGYTTDDFLKFYRKALHEIIECNKKGIYISEGHATIFLQKIIGHFSGNYMELRSPCGASTGQIAYYYDGNVYTCDEGRMLAEMGNPFFKLGNVYTDNYNTLMESRVCSAICQASVLEGLASCSDCVYQPYCGVCPVINLALDNNIYERQPNNYRCRIYKGILDTLFELLKDKEIEEIFQSWV